MSVQQCKIDFANLVGFSAIQNDGLPAQSFIESVNEIIQIISSFGVVFSPVIKDMNGNLTVSINQHHYFDQFKIKTILFRSVVT